MRRGATAMGHSWVDEKCNDDDLVGDFEHQNKLYQLYNNQPQSTGPLKVERTGGSAELLADLLIFAILTLEALLLQYYAILCC